MTSRGAIIGSALLLALAACAMHAQAKRPTPDHADVAYGAHARQRLDLWLGRPGARRPVIVFLPFGGFRAGSKKSIDTALLERLRAAGFAVAAVDYRLAADAPYPAPMHDAGRAVQYLRRHATRYNLDHDRVAAVGLGVGGGIALWLALHADRRAADGSDPVGRESTRLMCAAVVDAQTSYDPRFMRKHIGGRAHEHPMRRRFFGLGPGDVDDAAMRARYRDASPITHASRDDPPVYLAYRRADRPLSTGGAPGHGIHHPAFGHVLAARLRELGIAHRLDVHRVEEVRPFAAFHAAIVDFLREHLRAGDKS